MAMLCCKPLRLVAGGLFAALGVVLPGCSDDGFANRYPVTGMVTYQGKPLPSGSINFIPEAADARSATGSILNGKYNLTTHTPDDGALPGKYKVTITAYEGDLATVQAEADKQFQAKNAMPDQLAVGAAQKKSLIPEKYGSFEGSGLTADVKEQSNTIDFPLKD